jgi:hypothetical protein
MFAQLIVADAAQLDSNPSLHADVRRLVVFPRPFADQHGLLAKLGGNPHRDVSIVVMVVDEHRVDPFVNEECGRAVRQFFCGARQRHADLADSLSLFVAHAG